MSCRRGEGNGKVAQSSSSFPTWKTLWNLLSTAASKEEGAFVAARKRTSSPDSSSWPEELLATPSSWTRNSDLHLLKMRFRCTICLHEIVLICTPKSWTEIYLLQNKKGILSVICGVI